MAIKKLPSQIIKIINENKNDFFLSFVKKLINMTSIVRTRSQVYSPAAVFKTVLTDRSGSMFTFHGKQYEMVYRLLMDAKTQAVDTKVKTNIDVISFDTVVEYILQNCNLLEETPPTIKELESALYPRGCTRFNDTLVEQIEILTKKKDNFVNSLSNKAKKLDPDIVQVLIAITDGEDNSSKKSVIETRDIVKEFRKMVVELF